MSEIKINLPRHYTDKEIREWMKQVTVFLNNLYNVPADSTAVDVAGIVADHNAFLQHIRDLTTGGIV